jgi:hypothetical protein
MIIVDPKKRVGNCLGIFEIGANCIQLDPFADSPSGRWNSVNHPNIGTIPPDDANVRETSFGVEAQDRVAQKRALPPK